MFFIPCYGYFLCFSGILLEFVHILQMDSSMFTVFFVIVISIDKHLTGFVFKHSPLFTRLNTQNPNLFETFHTDGFS